MNPTPPDSLYIWTGLSRVECGRQVIYMKTHPKHTRISAKPGAHLLVNGVLSYPPHKLRLNCIGLVTLGRSPKLFLTWICSTASSTQQIKIILICWFLVFKESTICTSGLRHNLRGPGWIYCSHLDTPTDDGLNTHAQTVVVNLKVNNTQIECNRNDILLVLELND